MRRENVDQWTDTIPAQYSNFDSAGIQQYVNFTQGDLATLAGALTTAPKDFIQYAFHPGGITSKLINVADAVLVTAVQGFLGGAQVTATTSSVISVLNFLLQWAHS